MSASNYVHLTVKLIVAQTEKAFLLRLDDDEEQEVWIPFSQLADPDDYSVGDADVEIAVTRWIAREKGLCDE